ncbi:hypothetical protein vBSenS3_92 [Salmonella phage vB_SenS-3]|uniref:Uncharacterized protein n=2 Tax=Viruses TaxID=10239 RepID=A0A4P8NDZ3_9CAUD|nr:hypothetical protein HWC16_gp171 [Salmonella phage Sepoy]QCQ65571.1 hypothetical protein Sepoy_094 [Salmonella phage Sepoy]QIN93420.1 hypothetical protein vBSenS3_92 [Salmonella phage vB_SenS-3]
MVANQKLRVRFPPTAPNLGFCFLENGLLDKQGDEFPAGSSR